MPPLPSAPLVSASLEQDSGCALWDGRWHLGPGRASENGGFFSPPGADSMALGMAPGAGGAVGSSCQPGSARLSSGWALQDQAPGFLQRQPPSRAVKNFPQTSVLPHLSHGQPSKCQTLPPAPGGVTLPLPPNVTQKLTPSPTDGPRGRLLLCRRPPQGQAAQAKGLTSAPLGPRRLRVQTTGSHLPSPGESRTATQSRGKRNRVHARYRAARSR